MDKKEFYKRFPSREMKVLTIGKGARSIIARNCIDKKKIGKVLFSLCKKGSITAHQELLIKNELSR